jgi:hypothetical protein
LRQGLRCAIIVTGTPSDAKPGVSIGDLVDAKRSQQNIQLVDRQSIDRVLQEQSVSKSGLVEAPQAISTGKLLSADFLALINTASESTNRLYVFIRYYTFELVP